MDTVDRNELIASLKADVYALATASGREVGSAGHEAARQYLLGRMQAEGLLGYTTEDDEPSYELPYEFQGMSFCNLLGVVPGKDRSLDPVLIAAHYDTCMALPGADDNAAAISIALACIASLRQTAPERDVIFAFFDGEEPPFFHSEGMGSIVFYKRQRKTEIHAAIVLDLVGHDVGIPGFEDLIFVTGAESDPGLANVLRASCQVDGLRTLAALNSYVGDMSDHHIFRVNERPFLFLSCGRWEHYHQATDTPDRLSYNKMANIQSFVLNLLYAASASSLSGPFDGNDTFSLEKELLEANAGPVLQQIGLNLRSRADIDQLVYFLMGQFSL